MSAATKDGDKCMQEINNAVLVRWSDFYLNISVILYNILIHVSCISTTVIRILVDLRKVLIAGKSLPLMAVTL